MTRLLAAVLGGLLLCAMPASTQAAGHYFAYPALGIESGWSWYGCEYGFGNLGPGVYRYACVGGENVYLIGHGTSTFGAIRRAYHHHRIEPGQVLYYADQPGTVTAYRVKWVRRVTKRYLAHTYWRWAMRWTARPVLTLQTCDRRYRIIVRAV